MPPLDARIQISSPPANAALHSHLALIIGHASPQPPGTAITVYTPDRPPVSFPVRPSGRFKALAALTPGPNSIRLTLGGTTIEHPVTYAPQHETNEPVHLVIVAARDSDLKYDDLRRTTLEDAIVRFRMAACLWQCYTAEQMLRNGFGPRTFPLALEWGPDTISGTGRMENVPKVTLVRSSLSMAEIRHTNMAQQNPDVSKRGPSLFSIAAEAIGNSPEFRGKRAQVSALIIDSTIQGSLIVGHAALGGAYGDYELGIFGSHTTFAWPSTLNEVVPCFLNQRPVDRRFCGVDCEGSTYQMAANVGIGAFLHESGHMLGSPHQPFGVMARDYVRLHKSFVATDDDSDECRWHRLDVVRFVGHRSFAEPWDPPRGPEPGPVLATSSGEGIQVNTPNSAILVVEYRKPGKESAYEFDDLVQRPVQSLTVPRPKLQPYDRITVLTTDGGKLNDLKIADMMNNAKGGLIKTPTFGNAAPNKSAITIPRDLQRIRVYAGSALDGFEVYPGGALVGGRGGSPKDFNLNPGERIVGIRLRHGAWIDGIQFITTQRESPWFGRADGGGPGEARVPSGYAWSGATGSSHAWLYSLAFEFAPEGAIPQQPRPPPPQSRPPPPQGFYGGDAKFDATPSKCCTIL